MRGRESRTHWRWRSRIYSAVREGLAAHDTLPGEKISRLVCCDGIATYYIGQYVSNVAPGHKFNFIHDTRSVVGNQHSRSRQDIYGTLSELSWASSFNSSLIQSARQESKQRRRRVTKVLRTDLDNISS